jgi:Tfp pilus assembly protein PilN
VLVLAISLAVAGAMLERYRDARESLARLETESGLIAPERRAARPVSKERLDEEVKSAEAVVRQLALPWGALVRAVEQAATRDVAILQLQPDAEQRLLRLTAEARNREAMFEYLRRLAADRGLADVHLVSHHVQKEDPQRPIQFSVQAALRDGR